MSNSPTVELSGSHRRATRILVAASLLAWLGWALVRPLCHPYADLACGNYTDHFSDMNVARVLAAEGPDVWLTPLRDLGEPLSEAELETLPPDIRTTGQAARSHPGWPGDKPFVSSFDHLPSLTPPGGLLLTAPVAASYHATEMSFSLANRLLIALFLVYAHASLYVFFRAVAGMQIGTVGFLGAFAIYGEMIFMTLQGFSEGAIVGPLILSALALRRDDGLEAIGWFTLAVSLHFRALFFLPLLFFGAFRVIRGRQWERWARREWVVFAAISVMGTVTLLIFGSLLDAFAQIPITNPVNRGVLLDDLGLAALLLGMLGLLSAILLWSRAWWDLAVLVWVFVMFTILNEAYPWNVVTLLAWLGMPVLRGRWRSVVRDVRFVAILFLAMVVLRHGSFPIPIWVQQLF